MANYVKQPWVDGTTPVDAAHLNHIEDGIFAAVPADGVAAAGATVLQNKLTGADTQPAFKLYGNGRMDFGAGGSTAPDTALYRSGVPGLTVTGGMNALSFAAFKVLTDPQPQLGLVSDYSGAGQPALILGTGAVSPDTWIGRLTANWVYSPGNFSLGGNFIAASIRSQAGTAQQIYLQADGKLTFNSLADTNLYRSAADRLDTDDLFQALTMGLATKQKAGAPVDGDWAAAPPNGTLVVDSTGSKLWARVGGVWKGVAIA